MLLQLFSPAYLSSKDTQVPGHPVRLIHPTRNKFQVGESGATSNPEAPFPWWTVEFDSQRPP